MRGLGILILVVVFFWLVWPAISKWLKRKAMERTEDYLRRSMGMPPRDRKKERNRKSGSQYQSSFGERERRNPFGPDSYTNEPLIPKEYAEDVEYVETKEFSSTTEYHRKSDGNSKVYHESQISDVEWTEIKQNKPK